MPQAAALTGPFPAFLPLHGIGGSKDLPIPLELAITGATAALVISFCVLALAWREPRYEGPRPGRPVPGVQRVDRAQHLVGLGGAFAQHHAEGGCTADRRCAAHHHVADRFRDLLRFVPGLSRLVRSLDTRERESQLLTEECRRLAVENQQSGLLGPDMIDQVEEVLFRQADAIEDQVLAERQLLQRARLQKARRASSPTQFLEPDMGEMGFAAAGRAIDGQHAVRPVRPAVHPGDGVAVAVGDHEAGGVQGVADRQVQRQLLGSHHWPSRPSKPAKGGTGRAIGSPRPR